MDRINNWIYASSDIRPKQGEEVLCDLGKEHHFFVMKYENGTFYDFNNKKNYNLGTGIKRWTHIGKHCDEQF